MPQSDLERRAVTGIRRFGIALAAGRLIEIPPLIEAARMPAPEIKNGSPYKTRKSSNPDDGQILLWTRRIRQPGEPAVSGESFFLEQIVERLAHVVTLDSLRAAARSERNAVVRLEVFAKISLQFIGHVISLWLAALLASAGIEVAAILATMHIRIAMRAFILAQDFADDFDLSSTVVTNHNAPDELRISYGSRRYAYWARLSD